MSRGVLGLPASTRLRITALLAAAAAALLSALWLPLWQMKLEAPQYPDGLRVVAYGERVEGDLAEINIVNHYIGMAPLEVEAVPEMRLFPWGIKALVAGCLVALLARPLLRLLLLAVGAFPLVILGDLQWWLHRFGHQRDPNAPLRFVEPFTPPVIGFSTIGNFRSINMVSFGFFALALAALLVYLALRRWPRAATVAVRPNIAVVRAASVVLVAAGVLLGAMAVAPAAGSETAAEPAAARPVAELQARVDAAGPGGLVEVRGGHYVGTLHLTGPLVLQGVAWPVLDGGGTGSVVEIEGDGVVLRGFRIRGSGRAVSAESAGVEATGDRHRIEHNRIEDVYFGVHLSDGAENVVRGNVIAPTRAGDGERPGHAISLWYQRGARVESNRITGARDGIYLSFSDDVVVAGNRVEESRYGVHSMYSLRSRFEGNEIEGNLVGAALMYSEGLVLSCNRIEDHRQGATAYGILLKDVADVRIEGNVLAGNGVALYADSTPLGSGQAVVAGNLIVGNEAALALQSTARLTFFDNVVMNNLLAVRLEGRRLASGNVWAQDGRGNHWDEYRGFDRDGDGIGDLPHLAVLALPRLLRGDEPARALLWTPAHQMVEASSRLFPVVRPVPVIDDPAPLMEPPPRACAEARG